MNGLPSVETAWQSDAYAGLQILDLNGDGLTGSPVMPRYPLSSIFLLCISARAAESTIFKRLRLQLRLRPGNIDSDSNSASTPTEHGVSIPQEQCDMAIFHFPFACIQTSHGVIEHPLAVTADETCRMTVSYDRMTECFL